MDISHAAIDTCRRAKELLATPTPDSFALSVARQAVAGVVAEADFQSRRSDHVDNDTPAPFDYHTPDLPASAGHSRNDCSRIHPGVSHVDHAAANADPDDSTVSSG